MSRTYRRRTDAYDLNRSLRDLKWVETEDGLRYLEWVPLQPGTKEYAISVAKYHGDGRTRFLSSAPHWYCNVFERKARRFANRQLKRWLDNPEFEVQLQANHRNSATWNWW